MQQFVVVYVVEALHAQIHVLRDPLLPPRRPTIQTQPTPAGAGEFALSSRFIVCVEDNSVVPIRTDVWAYGDYNYKMPIENTIDNPRKVYCMALMTYH